MAADAIIDGLIDREGREYSNRPADKGGPTKFGITRTTLAAWRNQDCTADDVKALEEEEARVIYYVQYIREPGFDLVADDWLQTFIVDFGVNSGPATAAKALQRVLGVAVDGEVGPETLGALAKADITAVRRGVYRERSDFLMRLALNDPAVLAFRKETPTTPLENLRGWNDRLLQLLP